LKAFGLGNRAQPEGGRYVQQFRKQAANNMYAQHYINLGLELIKASGAQRAFG
jgi:hypothetical protein